MKPSASIHFNLTRNMTKKTVLFSLILSLIGHLSLAQVYFGGGYTESLFDDTNYDYVKGIDIVLHKQFQIKSSRWSGLGIMHTGLLYSDVNQVFRPAYISTVSITPAISFDIIKSNWFRVSTFLGPCVRWTYIFVTDDFPDSDPDKISNIYAGGEFGLSLDFAITEKLHLRLVPVNVQRSTLKPEDDRIRQGIVSVMLSL